MHRLFRAALLAASLLVVAGPAVGQGPAWGWKAGQVLTYQVDHHSVVTNTTKNGEAISRNQLKLVKRWQVVAVDAAGVATLQMSLASMWMKSTPPRGEALVFDSTNPMASDPQLREQMARYVGQPLAVLRVDRSGKVVEVKESKFGAASRFENELPFHVLLPAQMPTANQGWQRDYQITLEPPQGTGEKFAAVQNYTCKAVNNAALVVTFKTELKDAPPAKADSIPLLQFLPEGEATFDLATGRLKSAVHATVRELKDHAGPESRYKFESTYREELKEN